MIIPSIRYHIIQCRLGQNNVCVTLLAQLEADTCALSKKGVPGGVAEHVRKVVLWNRFAKTQWRDQDGMYHCMIPQDQ